MVTIYDTPKIDCHNHLLDPAHFGYAPDAWYHPVANEQGTARQLTDLFDAYGSPTCAGGRVPTRDTTRTTDACWTSSSVGNGRFKGVAVVDNDTSRDELERLRDRGVVGTTMQAALLGVEAFRDTEALLHDLASLDMFADVQVEARPIGRDGADSGAVRGARADRPLRTTRSHRRPRSAGVSPVARPRVERPVLRQDLRPGEMLGEDDTRGRIPGRSCRRCSRPSRRTAACGDRTGRSCGPPSASTTG